jgi:hypothetical protein
MRRTLPTLAAFLALSAPLCAQGSDDYALRFNGATDFVAMPQTTTAVNSFTIDLWVNPTADHQIDRESLAGYDGIEGQRYALYPSHGTHCWGAGNAGVGISVGTNGVSVYEHAGEYIPAVLVYEGAISGWTRVTLVYRDRTPSLYIDGRLVREGRQSPMPFVHPSTGDAHPGRMIGGIGGGPYGYFAGEIDNVRIWSRSMSAEEIASPLRADESLLVSLAMNQTGAGGGLVVDNAGVGGREGLALTHGTERSPVFTMRSHQGEARIGVIDGPREMLSTPLEYRNADESTPTRSAATPTLN